jgi:hypothetical protein
LRLVLQVVGDLVQIVLAQFGEPGLERFDLLRLGIGKVFFLIGIGGDLERSKL